jgi:hypothetical protein
MDGEQYHSSRRSARNIKITLGLEPDYALMDVKTLRDQLYSFFMPKTVALMTYHLFDKFSNNILENTLDLEIEGRIETFESPLFTADPVVDISLICYDPDFIDPNPVTVNANTINTGGTGETISYEGTVDTGVVFKLMPDRDVTDLTIYHRPPDQSIVNINFATPLAAGDVLTISSIPGSKSVVKTSGGVDTSVLFGYSPQSGWIELQPGDNLIQVIVDGAPMPYSIEYLNRYGAL